MNYLRIKHFLYLITYILFSCGSDISVSFDDNEWRSDQGGCDLKRLALYQDILESREELLGLSSGKIIRILGKPERNQLYQRNQKFFVYQISPSATCRADYKGSELFLFIRFNAVGRSQEIFIRDEPGLED